ncbi:MAG: hypothetical protein EHM40_16300 [Chloroflexi bacterium]|nr:MAG: hypothetical protein EHM40_16300 [Chloroflexota bacterium]
MKALYIVLGLILLAGCAPSPEELTATAAAGRAQTQTAAPTRTATPTRTPTKTPKPTSTSTSTPTNIPTPTPAVVEGTVPYKNLEITLLEADTHSHIVNAWSYFYYSEAGKIYIDLAVRVRNREESAVSVFLKEIYIIEENGEIWYPAFSDSRTVELERAFIPMASLKLQETYAGNDLITFKKDTYLRLAWYVAQGQEVLFGIQDSPQFIIPVE